MRQNVLSARCNNRMITIREKRVRIFPFDKIWSRTAPRHLLWIRRGTPDTPIFSINPRSGARRENFLAPRVSNIKHANGRGLRRVAVRACVLRLAFFPRASNPFHPSPITSPPGDQGSEGLLKSGFSTGLLTCPATDPREIMGEAALPGADD